MWQKMSLKFCEIAKYLLPSHLVNPYKCVYTSYM